MPRTTRERQTSDKSINDKLINKQKRKRPEDEDKIDKKVKKKLKLGWFRDIKLILRSSSDKSICLSHDKDVEPSCSQTNIQHNKKQIKEKQNTNHNKSNFDEAYEQTISSKNLNTAQVDRNNYQNISNENNVINKQNSDFKGENKQKNLLNKENKRSNNTNEAKMPVNICNEKNILATHMDMNGCIGNEKSKEEDFIHCSDEIDEKILQSSQFKTEPMRMVSELNKKSKVNDKVSKLNDCSLEVNKQNSINRRVNKQVNLSNEENKQMDLTNEVDKQINISNKSNIINKSKMNMVLNNNMINSKDTTSGSIKSISDTRLHFTDLIKPKEIVNYNDQNINDIALDKIQNQQVVQSNLIENDDTRKTDEYKLTNAYNELIEYNPEMHIKNNIIKNIENYRKRKSNDETNSLSIVMNNKKQKTNEIDNSLEELCFYQNHTFKLSPYDLHLDNFQNNSTHFINERKIKTVKKRSMDDVNEINKEDETIDESNSNNSMDIRSLVFGKIYNSISNDKNKLNAGKFKLTVINCNERFCSYDSSSEKDFNDDRFINESKINKGIVNNKYLDCDKNNENTNLKDKDKVIDSFRSIIEKNNQLNYFHSNNINCDVEVKINSEDDGRLNKIGDQTSVYAEGDSYLKCNSQVNETNINKEFTINNCENGKLRINKKYEFLLDRENNDSKIILSNNYVSMDNLDDSTSIITANNKNVSSVCNKNDSGRCLLTKDCSNTFIFNRNNSSMKINDNVSSMNELYDLDSSMKTSNDTLLINNSNELPQDVNNSKNESIDINDDKTENLKSSSNERDFENENPSSSIDLRNFETVLTDLQNDNKLFPNSSCEKIDGEINLAETNFYFGVKDDKNFISNANYTFANKFNESTNNEVIYNNGINVLLGDNTDIDYVENLNITSNNNVNEIDNDIPKAYYDMKNDAYIEKSVLNCNKTSTFKKVFNSLGTIKNIFSRSSNSPIGSGNTSGNNEPNSSQK